MQVYFCARKREINNISLYDSQRIWYTDFKCIKKDKGVSKNENFTVTEGKI